MSHATAVDEQAASTPRTFELQQNYPNPFAVNGAVVNSATTIKYQLPSTAQIELTIHDLAGRVVAKFDVGVKEAGEYFVEWNGRDGKSAHVASGIYFYRLTATSVDGNITTLSKKLAVLR
ncbi:T9SS type A sorting domain-containing protein [candidate division KSB1 bacterium]|nr:T9SS type A sorting domain-containing protein [candidate division KSB1 bacterium]